MSIITIGIDLAKNVFAVHGVNESGRAELVKPRVARDQLLPLIANLLPSLIGMIYSHVLNKGGRGVVHPRGVGRGCKGLKPQQHTLSPLDR